MFIITHQVRALAALAFLALALLAGLSLQRTAAAPTPYFVDERSRRAVVALVSAIRPRSTVTPGAPPLEARCARAGDAESLLLAIERGLRDMSAAANGGNRPLQDLYGVDRAALRESLTRDRVSTESLCAALRTLARGGGALLAQLDWNELPSNSRLPHSQQPVARVPSFWARQKDAWQPVPGCVQVRKGESSGASTAFVLSKASAVLCPPTGAVALDEPEAAPADWPQIQAGLLEIARKEGKSGTARIPARGVSATAPQAPHAASTLEAYVQRIAQSVARCMTGHAPSCASTGIDVSAYADLYERAPVRMMGVLVLDIPTGGIEAVGSAHTRCFAQEHDGPGRDPDCPDLPGIPRRRPAMLANHALHAAGMPGSLVKPVTAHALTSDRPYGEILRGPGADALRRDLQHSLSASFHDRLFCADRGFEDCARPAGFHPAALALGWNAGCASPDGCSLLDLGRGQYVAPAGEYLQVPAGRLGLVRDAAGRWVPAPSTFKAKWARECGRSPRPWEKCRGGGGGASELLAEAWGQGNAEASPASIALMMAKLGAAANGRGAVALPHLYAGTPGRAHAAAQLDVGISQEFASLIVSGLALTHRGGTASPACAAAWRSPACSRMTWIAGKTATPQFSHDRLTLAQRLEACRRAETAWREAADAGRRAATRVLAERANCAMSPYKWYAGLVRTGADGWDKVVVVMVERNWNQRTGYVDSAGDRGVNIAARAAFELIGRAWGGMGKQP